MRSLLFYYFSNNNARHALNQNQHQEHNALLYALTARLSASPAAQTQELLAVDSHWYRGHRHIKYVVRRLSLAHVVRIHDLAVTVVVRLCKICYRYIEIIHL